MDLNWQEVKKRKLIFLAKGVGSTHTFIDTLWNLADKKKIFLKLQPGQFLRPTENGSLQICQRLGSKALCVVSRLSPWGWSSI